MQQRPRALPPEEEEFARLVVRTVLGRIPIPRLEGMVARGESVWQTMGGLERGLMRTGAGIYRDQVRALTGAKLAEACLLERPDLYAAMGPSRIAWLERQVREISAAL